MNISDSLTICHFKQGSSMGQFFKQYLEPIKLNDVHVGKKCLNVGSCLRLYRL